MAASCTMNDLPPELLYTILSHRIGDILFDYLFLAPLVPCDDTNNDVEELTESLIFNGNSLVHPFANANANAHAALGGESPNTAVVDEWTSRRTTRFSHHNRAGGNGATDVDAPLKEISSLGCVSVAWRIVLGRILGNILHQDYLPHRDQHQAASLCDYHLTPPSRQTPVTTPPVLSLGNHHVLLRSMQVTLRTLLQESIDNYRMEQESLVVPGHQPGVNTPTGSNTPSQMTIAIPNTNTAPLSIPTTTLLPQPTICTLISALTADACPFVQLPIFTEALRYTQASIFTCDDNTKNTASIFGSRTTRNDLSLTLTSARISGALDLLRDPSRLQITRSPIRPKEISETVCSGMDIVSGKLQKALQVCQWNDLLENVFLRGERSDEVLTEIHACFESLEEQSGSIEMFHLLRSGLFKTVQCISRVGVVSHGYGGGGSNGDGEGDGEAGRLETASEEWKVRAGVLSFCWTGRVIGWNGI